jgi:hypothetical protein
MTPTEQILLSELCQNISLSYSLIEVKYQWLVTVSGRQDIVFKYIFYM